MIEKPLFTIKPLSNFDIADWISYMRIPNFNGVISREQIPSCVNRGYYIVNLNDSTQPGSHWVALNNRPNIIEYFDSFGMNAPMELVNLSNRLNVNYLYNSTQYQDLTSVLCGYYCLYFVNESHKGKSYLSILKPFSHTSSRSNERLITNYFQKI